jgi:hypothetical protein
MGGGGAKAKIKIEQGKQKKTFFDISNGVRKKFLNVNIEDIGAKKGFKHVLTRICICEGKFFCTLT